MEQPAREQYDEYVIKEPWYTRAGRATKRTIRRAILPTAITLCVATAAYGGFQMGRQWQYLDSMEQGLEEKLAEVKVERRVVRKNGRLYYYEKSETYSIMENNQLKKQLVEKQPGQGKQEI